MSIGPVVVSPRRAYARLAWPPILVRQARKPVLKIPTPLYLYDHLSIMKIWLTFVSILIVSRFETKPLILLYFTKISLILSHETFGT